MSKLLERYGNVQLLVEALRDCTRSKSVWSSFGRIGCKKMLLNVEGGENLQLNETYSMNAISMRMFVTLSSNLIVTIAINWKKTIFYRASHCIECLIHCLFLYEGR